MQLSSSCSHPTESKAWAADRKKVLPDGCAINNIKLIHKPQTSSKISGGLIDLFSLNCRRAGIKIPWVTEGLIEQGKGTERAVVGQYTSTKDHAIAAYKAIIPNSNWLAVLAVLLKINGVTEQLGSVTGYSSKCTYGDSVGGVDVVVLSD